MGKIKIAVTGSNGFLGKYLIDALRQKEDLKLVLFDKTKNSLFNCSTLESFLTGVSTVIHLAGANRDSDFNLIKINTLGTMGLLKGMLTYAPNAKLIFSSSFQAKGKSIYGLSKAYAEKSIEQVCSESSIKGIILRISNIYGKGAKPFYNSAIATFINQIREGKRLLINGDGNQKRDYVYVQDAVDAIVKSISFNPSSTSEHFDICSGEMTSINDIIEILKKLFSQKIEVEYNKKSLVREEEFTGSPSKAKKSLSWIPRISMEEGLRQTVG